MDLKNKCRSFLSSLGSLRTGLCLLACLIVFSIAGTLIPQDLTSHQYIQKYGERVYVLLEKYGLLSLYSSWWFISLLILLGINLFLCTLQKITLKKTSLVALHAGLIIVLAGSVITSLFGVEGRLELREGETSSQFRSGRRSLPLPFAVTLRDFQVSYYPAQVHILAFHAAPEDEMAMCRLKEGEGCVLDKSGYAVVLKKYIPDLVVGKDGPENAGDEPRNPAVLLEIKKEGEKEQRWVFAHFPGVMPVKFSGLEVFYRWGAQVREYSSILEITDERKGTFPVTVQVNHPFSREGYTLYQTGYDAEDLTWTGLSVKKDPGVKIIFAGFVLINISVAFYYYRKIKARSRDVA